VIYAAFFASALVTAALFGLAARVMFGIEHTGLLIAIGIIGGGIQMIVLMVWYLRQMRAAASAHQVSEDHP
jgi:hypothetical protein